MNSSKPGKKIVKTTTDARRFIKEAMNTSPDRRPLGDVSESVAATKLLTQYSKLPKKYDTPVNLRHVLALIDVLYGLVLELRADKREK